MLKVNGLNQLNCYDRKINHSCTNFSLYKCAAMVPHNRGQTLINYYFSLSLNTKLQSGNPIPSQRQIGQDLDVVTVTAAVRVWPKGVGYDCLWEQKCYHLIKRWGL